MQEAEVAREHGAAIVGGVELMKWVYVFLKELHKYSNLNGEGKKPDIP